MSPFGPEADIVSLILSGAADASNQFLTTFRLTVETSRIIAQRLRQFETKFGNEGLFPELRNAACVGSADVGAFGCIKS